MRLSWLIACAAVALIASTGCGGGDGGPSDNELRDRLLPVAEVDGFKLHRAFVWDNPIDLAGQGFPTGENSQPSEVVEAFEDAGFEKAAGEILRQGVHGPEIGIVAIKLGSNSDAKDMRDHLHREDLKQPCYGLCSQRTSTLEVTDIPDAAAASILPDPNAPAEAPPGFEAYAVEFPVGSYLYAVWGGADPGSDIKSRILSAARALYQRVKERDA